MWIQYLPLTSKIIYSFLLRGIIIGLKSSPSLLFNTPLYWAKSTVYLKSKFMWEASNLFCFNNKILIKTPKGRRYRQQ